MPTPLPAITVPDYAPTLNAYRTGMQDRIAQDERNVLKEAGGLAAAGNLGGARSALYKGGNFAEARNTSGEMRAIADQARQMESHKLEKAAKTYELFGRLIPTIKTPEQLEQAKGLIKQRTGMDFSGVTMEQLPMLLQQNVSVEQHLQREMEGRKLQAAKDIAATKASAPKPLTEAQAKARGYLGELGAVEGELPKSLVDGIESPLSSSSQRIAMNDYVPGEIQNMTLSKQQKQYLQNAEQFISVLLYHRSGAQISADEFKRNFRVYFPQPGDDRRTLAMKAKARKGVMDGLRIQGAMTEGSAPGAPDAPSSGNDDALPEGFKILGVE